ncbi:tetratricopeptide repeat protein [Streptomyces avicenniae]|uniref:tetratricopeptide repeat protein n=1 Tax=Streptomyces avicenniae TaxID=500153 RepID=UPI00069B2723|nr:tetratricopeptide repeat protein [Streptomyces avicenniae]
MSDLASWSVRISDRHGAIYGAGMHLGDGRILTCAHVVRDAVHATDVTVRPTDPVLVDFPGLSAEASAAVVEPDGWWPYDDALRGDAAVLRLSVPPPPGAAAAPLTSACPEGALVRAFGYPLERNFGVHAQAEIMGETLSQGWYQLDDSRLRGEQIRPGFSGAAVVLADTGQVTGMVSLATVDSGSGSPRVSWMLPVRLLAERLPPIARALRASAATRLASEPAADGLGRSCPLPSDIRDFTGRDDELVDADAEIEAADGFPVVHAVYGMGGVGKTTLAIRLAHRHGARYPDGQYFLDLQAHTVDAEPLTTEEALRALLQATLGQPPKDGVSLRELTAVWQDVARLRRMVVVLDNAASFEQIEPLLPRAGEALVLVTSRRWLEELGVDNSAPRQLPPFAEGASVELFTRMVGNQRTEAEPDAVRELVRLCGHLPLAIRLKAAYSRGRPAWSLADIRDEMAEEQRAVAESGVREAASPEDGRLRWLRLGTARPVYTAFLTSFRRLTGPQQRLFRLLGLHPPESMDRRVVEALAEDEWSGRAGLDVLVRESLVNEHGRSRIGMHDLLREFAREELAAAEPWEVRRQASGRLIDFYLATALAARRVQLPARPVPDAADTPHRRLPDVSSPALSSEWFEAEHRNLLGCMDLAARYGHASHLWRLPRAMGLYLSLSAHSKDAIPRYETAIEAAKTSDRRAEADLRGLLGDALRTEGKQERALAEFRAARSLYIELGDTVLAADMLARGSAPQRDVEGAEQSVASCARAAEEYAAAGDSFGSAEAEYLLAMAARLSGDRTRALGHLGRALHLYEEAAFTAGQARCLNLMGVIQRLGGDHATAIGTLREAVRLYRTAHDNRGIAHALNNLASALALAGKVEEAVGLHGEALERFRRYSPHGYPDALLVASGLLSRQGDHVTAESRLREAVRLYRPMRAGFGEARAHLLLAASLRAQGRHAEGADAAEQALGLYLATGSESGTAAARTELDLCRAALAQRGTDG